MMGVAPAGAFARRARHVSLLLYAMMLASCSGEFAARQRNVILIVPDGVRWQEVFTGAERELISREGGVSDTTAILKEFWRESAIERREALMPFLWGAIAREGQVVGDRASGDTIRVTNGLNFSYPGYNEMLAGAPDARIRSNSHGPNPNQTVFAWLSTRPGFEGRVAAFATWGAFRDIFDAERSGVHVHAGWRDPFPAPDTDRQELINELHRTTTRLWPDNTLDVLTHQAALEYMRSAKPRVLFIGYGETDEWAHAGRYDLALRATRQVDAFIAELWQTVQSMPEYRDATTLVITTDHGRGDGRDGWQRHGEDVPGAAAIWMAIVGPDTPARTSGQPFRATQAQVAATIAALVGEDWTSANRTAAPALTGFLKSR
jgi:hypothetical protein